MIEGLAGICVWDTSWILPISIVAGGSTLGNHEERNSKFKEQISLALGEGFYKGMMKTLSGFHIWEGGFTRTLWDTLFYTVKW